ncbi:hypothetical protein COS91_07870 [Candidatus Desantisbacteria bacterium CG07_land_8_20_14_0_80_39_15]|uniref:Uncharacterized protein n=1 Tax=Candidatus Desantisbacteria bacterium CG07_land_8_20_14_0_80_39_15 TaxID=1974549 RepID=A0A2M6ZEG6_9BACT|nr:MAG: hypothetical protein COS91_07870 [Candidatus Desantisbacteria bacterium CG07_land_8_20_14_0_80_39_15]
MQKIILHNNIYKKNDPHIRPRPRFYGGDQYFTPPISYFPISKFLLKGVPKIPKTIFYFLFAIAFFIFGYINWIVGLAIAG